MTHRWTHLCISAAVSLLWLACSTPASAPGQGDAPAVFSGAADAASAQNPDRLLVVDCMLPGQVRKLGSKLTYMSPRRPIKTTGVDCEIRGGEYVAFDRATYAGSLKIWLPLAEGGDPKAQTYVGEIFEKGLGATSDYASAAKWYRLAADQGYSAAQINLGQLYELGHGVPKDSKVALDWYRKASGLSDLDAQFTTFMGDAEQYQQLRSELDRRSTEAQGLRQQVSSLHTQLGETRKKREREEDLIDTDAEQLAKQREELEAKASKLAADEMQLREEQQELASQRAATKASAPQQPAEPDAATLAREKEIEKREAELSMLSANLKQEQDAAAKREKEIEARSRELAAMDANIKSLAAEAEKRRAAYQKKVEVEVAQLLEGPSIILIDPAIPLTRSTDGGGITVQSKDRNVIGRVDAPAGLVSLLVNDVEATVDKDGFFETEIRVRPVGTLVKILAIDQQGKRAARSFTLRRGGPGGAAEGTASAPISVRTTDAGIDFGRYYALVIGNSNYQYMPSLETARADASTMSELLQSKYGFEVTQLLDGSRYQILAALNEMRGKLTERDNFVLYYAGHGDFDAKGDEGYWLPVDARPENEVNWISNRSITDILNAVEALHVLVVADSCYSGSLTETAIPRISSEADTAKRGGWMAKITEKSSRTALTSGGLAPVLDGGGGNHSVFARALIDILENNDGVLDGNQLHSELAARVRYQSRTRAFQQDPEYAPIRFGHHGGGEFFFVPKG